MEFKQASWRLWNAKELTGLQVAFLSPSFSSLALERIRSTCWRDGSSPWLPDLHPTRPSSFFRSSGSRLAAAAPQRLCSVPESSGGGGLAITVFNAASGLGGAA